ncbi:hypothetical protein BWQ96_00476 [Gracilariopsis chorda]|uniref:Uncharacterized protein n=1 Tax=Gracilariopsis chorda TaxID=448386 RepID=A0A2V3J624_9FLOR|nr:hypothetical protein BWQ96_00476 [Gracilariopsis chorda]|eukprot:PXF49824.1 hypothetical protein BWQ96_00476 [Gracilariopsis chorda]
MEGNNDQDDVNVYVSPKHFGGHTPGAKATRQKVFEENLKRAAQEREAQKENQMRMGMSTHAQGLDDMDGNKNVHRAVGRNNKLSIVTLIINYLAAFFSFPVLSMGIWVALKERNGGVSAYVARAGQLIKSPLVLGFLLMFGAGFLLIFSYFFGVKELSPAINQGMSPEKKKAFLVYQLMAIVSMVLLTLVLLSTVDPLRHAKTYGVTKTNWIEMSVSHPGGVCRYEMENDCAGYRDMACADPAARRSRACPGHFCSETCGAGSKDSPRLKVRGCDACYKDFAREQPLARCKTSEGSGISSSACLSTLRSDVIRFYLITIIASGVGLLAMLFVTLFGAVSSLISFEL